jgi:hypothetical protein
MQVLTVWKRVKEDASSPNSKLNPKAVDLVKEAAKLMQHAKSIRTEGTVITSGDFGGGNPGKTKSTWAMDNPNKINMRLHHRESNETATEMVSDGQKLFIHDTRRKEYVERSAPRTLTEIGDRLPAFGIPNIGILFRNLLTENPVETLMLGVNTCVYAGIERIADQPAHYLKFTQDDFNWDLWIAAEGKPVILKVRSVFPGDVIIVETYKDWQIDATIPPDTFTFTPPEGSKKVDRLGGAGS